MLAINKSFSFYRCKSQQSKLLQRRTNCHKTCLYN